MDLSIIIVNWNTRDLLRECLGSILESRCEYAFEVIVVDNASSDGSAEMVKACFPQIRLITNSSNHGFAYANNQAIEYAQGRYILLLNPDTKLPPDNLDKVINYMDRDENRKVGVLGCKLLYPDGTIQRSIRRSSTLFQTFVVACQLNHFLHSNIIFQKIGDWLASRFPRAFNSRLWTQYEVESDVESVLGAYYMVRRTLIDAIGGLDEDYFMFGEELDYSLRCQAAGYKVRYYPGTHIIHYQNQSVKKVNDEMYIELCRSSLLFAFKHHSKSYKTLLRVVWTIGAILYMLRKPRLLFARVGARSGEQRRFLISLMQVIATT